MSIASQTKAITVPSSFITFLKDVSPVPRHNDPKRLPLTIINHQKAQNLRHIRTHSEKFVEDDLACLVTVEKHYVRTLINSPLKVRSNTPRTQTKEVKNISPAKPTPCPNFESLTVCGIYSSKRRLFKRNKSSITPDPLKRK